MKVLLTLTNRERVAAGVEVFNEQLRAVFKDIQVIDAAKASATAKVAVVKEPMIAKGICDFLKKNLDSYDPDIIFTNGMYGWNLGDIGTPLVNIQHGGYAAFAEAAMKRNTLDYWRIRYIYSHFEKQSAKKSDLVVSNSQFTRDNIKNYYGIDSIVINNFIDTGVFRPIRKAREILGLPQDKKIALFVGRPDYSKGFDIIQELALLHKDIFFVCVLQPKVDSNIGNLITKSPVSPRLLAAYYSAADFTIFPSRFEGFGYVPLESLACNTPVIAKNVGILRDFVPPGCKIIGEASVKKYSKAISELETTQENIRKHITRKFSFKKFSKAYRKTVRDIL